MGTIKDPGGLRVIQNLEDIFTKNLPENVNTFINAVEGLMKIINYVATQKMSTTFIDDLAEFFAAVNASISGQAISVKNLEALGLSATQAQAAVAKWGTLDVKGTVNNMLNDWTVLETFLKTVIETTYNMFSHGKDQHIGTGILTQLTGFLDSLNQWEKSAQGSKQLSALFDAHKGLVTQVLNFIEAVIKGLGTLFLALAPSAATTAGVVIGGITKAINAIFSGLASIANLKLPGGGSIAALAGTGFGLAAVIPLLISLVKNLPGLKQIFGWMTDLLQGKKGGPSEIFAGAVGVFKTQWNNSLARHCPWRQGRGQGQGALGCLAGLPLPPLAVPWAKT